MLQLLHVDDNDEFRFIGELPIKLFIIDCKITILALRDSGSKTGQINTIFLDEPNIAMFMKDIFESRWKKGLTREEYNKLEL